METALKLRRGISCGTIVWGALLLLLAGHLGAQPSDPEPDEGRGYFMVGAFGLDLEPLNAELVDRNLPRVSTSFLTLGAGGHARFGRILSGGEGHVVLSNDATAGGFERSVGGALGFLNVGYLLTTEGAFQAYPILGVGAGRLSFRTVEVGAPSFGEVLDDPARGSRLTQTSFLVHAGVGTDYIITIVEDPEELRGVTLGLRVGYAFSLRERSWRMDGFRVTEGPGLGLTGPYIRLSVGGLGPR